MNAKLVSTKPISNVSTDEMQEIIRKFKDQKVEILYSPTGYTKKRYKGRLKDIKINSRQVIWITPRNENICYHNKKLHIEYLHTMLAIKS